jgi:hypothetical protein
MPRSREKLRNSSGYPQVVFLPKIISHIPCLTRLIRLDPGCFNANLKSKERTKPMIQPFFNPMPRSLRNSASYPQVVFCRKSIFSVLLLLRSPSLECLNPALFFKRIALNYMLPFLSKTSHPDYFGMHSGLCICPWASKLTVPLFSKNDCHPKNA